MTVHFREESNAVVEILPSLSLLRIMLIFDTESHILALLKLFFIYSLFLFSLFREPTWAKRALDSSHRPVTHSQACLLRAALRDTNFFGSALSFLIALYLFSGWTGKTWSSLLVRTSCCFVLRKRNGKQQTRTAVALRHTDTCARRTFRRTHSHKWTKQCTLKPSMRSGACTERSSCHVNPWRGCGWVCLPRLRVDRGYVRTCPSLPPALHGGTVRTSISHKGWDRVLK